MPITKTEVERMSGRGKKLKVQLSFDPDYCVETMIKGKLKRTFPERSMTIQSQSKDANINNIMKKYRKTGVLGDPFHQRSGYFGDFTDGEKFRTNSQMIAEAKSDFEMLPIEMRTKFDNDVSKLLDFVAEPANEEAAIKMGLLEATAEVPPADEVEPEAPAPSPEPAAPEEGVDPPE